MLTPRRELTSWGRDGWNITDWPYVKLHEWEDVGMDGSIYVYWVSETTEGDVWTISFPTEDQRFHWLDVYINENWNRVPDRYKVNLPPDHPNRHVRFDWNML